MIYDVIYLLLVLIEKSSVSQETAAGIYYNLKGTLMQI